MPSRAAANFYHFSANIAQNFYPSAPQLYRPEVVLITPHGYAPGSTGAAQTMAWLATEYAGVVIGENFENPIGLELCCHHGTCPPQVSSQPTGDHSAAL